VTRPRIVIIGAGLGGLTAGIALALRGFQVSVHEQALVLQEVGAGLTVSQSAQAALQSIGLMEPVQRIASRTPRMAFLHYRDGRLLAGAHDHTDGRWTNGSPPGGLHIHRADLHALLVARFNELAPGALKLGQRLVGLDEQGDTAVATFEDGAKATGGLLIGADGVRSAVRRALWGDGDPRFTGQVAYRFMLDRSQAGSHLEEAGRAAVFQGPGAVFNRYTLRGGDLVNCVGIVRTDEWTGDGWSTPATRQEMLDRYAGWHSDVTGLMAAAPADRLIKWGLFDRPPLDRWGHGAVTLLGDAAHPMLPFLGLGAALAIEDGLVLARALEIEPGPSGLRRYEAARMPRARRIAELSRLQGEASQSRDPDRYDALSAPAHDPAIQAYDPMTAALA
jgi:salicylate hydroxylase